jgi:hypothetical protein
MSDMGAAPGQGVLSENRDRTRNALSGARGVDSECEDLLFHEDAPPLGSEAGWDEEGMESWHRVHCSGIVECSLSGFPDLGLVWA